MATILQHLPVGQKVGINQVLWDPATKTLAFESDELLALTALGYKAATADVPTITAFTSDQLTQLAAILTSPPTMYWTIHATGVTATNPTLDVTSFLAGGDR